jgi:hypothetical protein
MAQKKIFDIFISHAWRYSEDYDRLMSMLKQIPHLNFRIHSAYRYDTLHPGNPGDKIILLEQMEQQILSANCVLVITRMHFFFRDWIQWTMDYAKKHNKPIIGIKSPGVGDIPDDISNKAHVMVNWDIEKIIQEILSLPC